MKKKKKSVLIELSSSYNDYCSSFLSRHLRLDCTVQFALIMIEEYSSVVKYRNSITQNDKIQDQVTRKVSQIQKL